MKAVIVTKDLLFSSQVVAAAKARGLAIEVALGAPSLDAKLAGGDVALVILDLASPGVDPAELVPRIRAAAGGLRGVVAFGPHVQEMQLDAARAAGCDQVFTRGQFHARGTDVIAKYLSE